MMKAYVIGGAVGAIVLVLAVRYDLAGAREWVGWRERTLGERLGGCGCDGAAEWVG